MGRRKSYHGREPEYSHLRWFGKVTIADSHKRQHLIHYINRRLSSDWGVSWGVDSGMTLRNRVEWRWLYVVGASQGRTARSYHTTTTTTIHTHYQSLYCTAVTSLSLRPTYCTRKTLHWAVEIHNGQFRFCVSLHDDWIRYLNDNYLNIYCDHLLQCKDSAWKMIIVIEIRKIDKSCLT